MSAPGHAGDIKATTSYKKIQGENKQDTEQSEFLGQDGQNKVGMAFRNEFKIGLGSVEPAFPHDAPGTNGNL